MLIRLNNLRVGLDNERSLADIVARRFNLNNADVKNVRILRRAVDARRKNNICEVYHLLLDLELTRKGQARILQDKDVSLWQEKKLEEPHFGQEKLTQQPIVIGSGPAGLMAALELAKYGYHPLLLERGKPIAQRVQDVDAFWRGGCFNPQSNVQFGEGGAGTFSDGKLTTRINDPVMGDVLLTFVAAGAPDNVLYEQKPHVGTDKLRTMVKGLVKRICAYGGTIRYEALVTDLLVADGCINGVELSNGERLVSNAIVLACGHSARDTYAMLDRHRIALEAKAFAIGVRIEHSQELISRAQYGEYALSPKLGAADYTLIHHEKELGRTVYSFCMCPGGKVVAAASESGGVVTNGMSYFNRDSGVANSALVVNVTPEDFGKKPLLSVEFQRYYERLAFAAGGHNYCAPAQNTQTFLSGTRPSLQIDFQPSYEPGLTPTDLADVLPDYVAATLRAGLLAFDKQLPGFSTAGLLIGVETRTSAPLRILRGPEGQSLSHANLYPAGEGAGYAGGIMSAAVDGYHAAHRIMERFKHL